VLFFFPLIARRTVPAVGGITAKNCALFISKHKLKLLSQSFAEIVNPEKPENEDHNEDNMNNEGWAVLDNVFLFCCTMY
jgi:hypothetical protein